MKKTIKKITLTITILGSSVNCFPHNNSSNPNSSKTNSISDQVSYAWQQIPAEVKAFGGVIITSVIVAYLTAKIFQKVSSNSQEIPWRLYTPGQIKESFSCVAGAYEAKDALSDVIQFFKKPKSFKKIGAKIPHGILLTGNPGNGKTLLARALAGEVKCNFISVSGSDFVEMYVGVGAARIKQLFSFARKHAPCIIFIDELDALGKTRGYGSQEHDHALNQLLKELDGFESKKEKPIVILGATNHESMLDPALIRPGRFDRIINIPTPDQNTREAILKIHTSRIKTANDLDITLLAQHTAGFSGAALANMVNQAAILSAKRNVSHVSMAEFEETLDTLRFGATTSNSTLCQQEQITTAYHEAGHALVHVLLEDTTSSLVKITITPRNKSLGMTHTLPLQDQYSFTKEQMLTNICITLAGQAAEELIFQSLSTGAHSDFAIATNMAREMICSYGMTQQLGKQVINQSTCSQALLAKVDQTVFEILQEQYDRALQLLKQHQNKLTAIAQALLKKQTLTVTEIYEILSRQ